MHALAAVGFGGEEVASRIGRDAVDGVELAGLAPTVTEAGQNFKRVAEKDVDFFIRTVGQENVFLLGILGKGDVPN